MNFSVIIPTYNRPDDLRRAIESILVQTILPIEVIVVDNAKNQETEQIVLTFANYNKIDFKYFRNHINSLSIAKNCGAKNAKGDILLFLDDDVILNEYYIEEILKVYKEFPTALIVQGNVISNRSNDFLYKIWHEFWRGYSKFFCLFHMTTEKKILISGKSAGYLNPNKIVNCQWANGGFSGVKREVFREFSFDDKLIKYCYCEDADFSYRIYKKYPKSIFLTPKATLVHKGSFNKEVPIKQAIIMEKTYNMYFMVKNLGKPINYVLFFWSELGNIIQNIFYVIFYFRRGRYFILNLIYSLYSLYICIKYHSKIDNLDIDYINNNYLL